MSICIAESEERKREILKATAHVICTQLSFGQNILKDIRTQDQTDETSLHETLSGKYLYYATFQLALSSVKPSNIEY